MAFRPEAEETASAIWDFISMRKSAGGLSFTMAFRFWGFLGAACFLGLETFLRIFFLETFIGLEILDPEILWSLFLRGFLGLGTFLRDFFFEDFLEGFLRRFFGILYSCEGI